MDIAITEPLDDPTLPGFNADSITNCGGANDDLLIKFVADKELLSGISIDIENSGSVSSDSSSNSSIGMTRRNKILSFEELPENDVAAITYEAFDRLTDLRRFHSCGSFADIKRNNKAKHGQLTSGTAHQKNAVFSPNYLIETNLESSQHSSKSSPGIIDSHTAYRKILDEEITNLKIKLAKTQAFADNIENEYYRSKADCDELRAKLESTSHRELENLEKVAELEIVVSTLQDSIRDGAIERVDLESKKMEMDNKCLELQHINKKYRNEFRRTKKELEYVRQEIEGKAMEVQGLKSENDWLKKQLWPEKNSSAESDESDDPASKVTFTGIRQFLSPRKPRRRRRQSHAFCNETGQNVSGKMLDVNEVNHELTSEAAPEDAEDRTAGYSSLTDFHFKSAPENELSGSTNQGNSFKKKHRQNSLIRKLALRHGAADTDDTNTRSESRQNPDDSTYPHVSFVNEGLPARNIPRSTSTSNNPRDKVHRKQIMSSTFSDSHLHQESIVGQKDKTDNLKNNQWNFWGMITGNDSKKDEIKEEEHTKDSSDSSTISDDFLQSKFGPSHASHLNAVKKVEQQTKSGTVLVPKRFSFK